MSARVGISELSSWLDETMPTAERAARQLHIDRLEDYGVHTLQAELAFNVHAALLKAQNDEPELALNPYWRAIRAHAFSIFLSAFVAL